MPKANLANDKLFLSFIKEGYFKIYRNGRIKNLHTGNYVGETPNSRGYGVVSRMFKGKIRHIQAHRFIWVALKGLITDPSIEVNHIDGNKINNDPDNHELLTQSGNAKHALEIGLSKPMKGEHNGFAKLSQKQVDALRIEYSRETFDLDTKSKQLGVHKQTLRSALIGETYEGQGIEIKIKKPGRKTKSNLLLCKFLAYELRSNREWTVKYTCKVLKIHNRTLTKIVNEYDSSKHKTRKQKYINKYGSVDKAIRAYKLL